MTLKEFLHRGHFLYFFSYWIYGLYMDKKIGGKALGEMRYNQRQKGCFPVQSTSYRMLDRVVDDIRLGPDDVFVDVGSGWGRLISYLIIKKKLTPKTMCRFIGVEINEEVAAACKQRFTEYPRVEIRNSDILAYLPKDATVLFLSNPFNADIMQKLLSKIEKELDHPIRLIYLHAVYHSVIERAKDHWTVELDRVVKPKHHVSFRFCIYRYTP